MRRTAIGILVLFVVGCGNEHGRKNDKSAGRVESAPREVAVTELAEIETVVCARRIAPAETLAVRILGTVGPNGSWALDRVDVERSPDGITITPRVRRVAGEMFIQVVIPLDRVEHVVLPVGSHQVRVRGRNRTAETTVRVEPGVLRSPPEVVLRSAPAVPLGDIDAVHVHVTARASDGFVAAIEVRETAGGVTGAWRAPESVQAEADSAAAVVTVRRPPGDGERRIDVCAVDGQGERTTPPATLLLPAR